MNPFDKCWVAARDAVSVLAVYFRIEPRITRWNNYYYINLMGCCFMSSSILISRFVLTKKEVNLYNNYKLEKI